MAVVGLAFFLISFGEKVARGQGGEEGETKL